MFVRIKYSNGYCGCDESEVLEVENIEEAEAYAAEAIYDYAESYSYISGWDEDFESEEDEEAYYENCNFDITEITEEEYQEEK